MRITYVCADPGIGVFGTKGASVHIQEMVRAMRRARHEVSVVALRKGDQVPADLADLPVQICTVAPGDDRESALIEAAKALPDIVFSQPVDLVYERYSLFSSDVQQQAVARRIPSVVEVNSPLIDEQRQFRSLVNGQAAEHHLRLVTGSASAVVCVSEPVRQWVLAHQESANALVIPNGVNINRITPRSTSRPDGPLTVGFVGTLKPWHGVDVLIRAVALAGKNFRLLVVGDGPEADSLRGLAGGLGVDAQFTGAVAPADIPGYLHQMDIAAAPGNTTAGANDAASQYFSPLKVFEYAAAGLPIVAGRIGQVVDLLVHGQTGMLVEPGDAHALAGAIGAVGANPELAARLGSAARSWVAGHSWDAVADKVFAAVARAGVRQGIA